MAVKREQWNYRAGEKVWVGRYRNSHNMPHWHYDCELFFVEKGSLKVYCNNTVFTVRAGQSVFIDSEQVHSMHALSPDTVVTMIIFDYGVIKKFTGASTLSSPVLSKDYDILNIGAEIKKELCGQRPLCEIKAALLVMLVIVEIFRDEKLIEKEKSRRTVERFKELLTEIDEKYEFYDLESAADFMGMSAAYFSRLFHKLTGMTFSQYLNFVRCENAVNILNSGEDASITEIASRCGFTTIRNFNRIFKEFTGYSPKTLPKDFVMNDNFIQLNEFSQNPTSNECELLESSDD